MKIGDFVKKVRNTERDKPNQKMPVGYIVGIDSDGQYRINWLSESFSSVSCLSSHEISVIALPTFGWDFFDSV